jgi:hypothetical protein
MKPKARWLTMSMCAGGLALLLVPNARAQEPSPTLDAIFRVWQERQDRTRWFTFEWEQRIHRTASAALTGAVGGSGPVAGGSKDFVQTVAQHGELHVDGERFNYQFERESDRLSSVRELFDGTNTKRLDEYQSGAPRGSVKSGAQHGQMLDVDVVPMLFTYRPLQSNLSKIYREDCVLTNQRGNVGSREYFIVEQRDRSAPIVYAYWVDPAREYVVVRYVTRVEGRERGRTDVDYSHDEVHGWIPTTWNRTFLNEDGALSISKTYRVTDYSINEPISDEKKIRA